LAVLATILSLFHFNTENSTIKT